MQALEELHSIEVEINNLRSKGDPMHGLKEVIAFGAEKIFRKAMDCIRVLTPEERCNEEDCLLMAGAKYDIRTKKLIPLKVGKELPEYCGLFQINRKLYISGG